MDRRVGAVESPGELLCELLEDLVARDFALLEHMEEQISALEELVLGEKTVRDFNRKMMRIRKALLLADYERLMNVSQNWRKTRINS